MYTKAQGHGGQNVYNTVCFVLDFTSVQVRKFGSVEL